MDIQTSSSCSSSLDRFIGIVEDIVITAEFQDIITTFMDDNHSVFDYEEENKLIYMEIFENYRILVESFIMQKVDELHQKETNIHDQIHDLERILANTPHACPLQEQGEVVELILSLTDYLVFKELMLDHKTSRMGKYDDFNMLKVTSIDRK